VAGGYADGIFRSLGGRSSVYVGDKKVPVVGRISMDSILVDVTGLGLENLRFDQLPQVELLGEHQGVDDLVSGLDLLSYDILTCLGQRFERDFLGEAK
jgi:alanine racemase